MSRPGPSTGLRIAPLLISLAVAACSGAPAQVPTAAPTAPGSVLPTPTPSPTEPAAEPSGYVPGTWSSVCGAFAAFRRATDDLAARGRAARLADVSATESASAAAEEALDEMAEHASLLAGSELTRSLATRFLNAARDRRAAAEAVREPKASIAEVRRAVALEQRARAEIWRAREFSLLTATALGEDACPKPALTRIDDPIAGISLVVPDGWTVAVGRAIDEVRAHPTADLEVIGAIAEIMQSAAWTTFGIDSRTLDVHGDRLPLLVGVSTSASRDPLGDAGILETSLEKADYVDSFAAFGVDLDSDLGGRWLDATTFVDGKPGRVVVFTIPTDDRLLTFLFATTPEDAASYVYEQLAFLDAIALVDSTD